METQSPVRATALPSREAIQLLADKWRMAIIYILRDGSLRTSRLQNALGGISPKMLNQTLRRMERDGLITRRVHPGTPLRVEYQLTAMGQSALKPMEELSEWAQAHAAEREAARGRFDQTARQTRIARKLDSK